MPYSDKFAGLPRRSLSDKNVHFASPRSHLAPRWLVATLWAIVLLASVVTGYGIAAFYLGDGVIGLILIGLAVAAASSLLAGARFQRSRG